MSLSLVPPLNLLEFEMGLTQSKSSPKDRHDIDCLATVQLSLIILELF
jgi:hypothetical protein